MLSLCIQKYLSALSSFLIHLFIWKYQNNYNNIKIINQVWLRKPIQAVEFLYDIYINTVLCKDVFTILYVSQTKIV